MRQVVEAFNQGGGEGKPMLLKVQLSYDRESASARQGAYEQWRNNIFDNLVLAELQTPAQFDAVGQYVSPEQLDKSIRISSELEQHIDWLQQDLELGFSELLLHNVNRKQEQFIEVFGEKVIPVLGVTQESKQEVSQPDFQLQTSSG